MYNLLLTILLVLSVLLVIAIFMQPQKKPSSNVFDSSGSEALFERTKARGFEAFMQRFTAVLVFFWLAIALVLAILSSK
ncbi:TPA: preprotein translocase subunit SecG [Streptococcus pyogenes]|uniref:preprotein translocase subunit SecG n=1 Tax=Streptococcus pyogenes TaxID=1314 RepID=UPI000640AF9E|nr:preprotein translocase subunit SecG [Streptococcus pyogenes]HER4515353.1 preprotein translocase subunit SecG [Streptococcus pyogenes NGAS743]HER4523653.1 preprotein translocase subunit SecG [Streptococcus pyogenes NGAS747]HER4527624.1 preprotein translocase subunit SecG [Streptococcus pyogenes NGAS739]HER4538731.1 preprotein translocase subunit SecG [Streptococcus pyogenes NGAS668]HER4542148.1 preprotein translocase subunit SecG [Streptococcus pyogenes NGAS669]HER4550845.1 preprotein trans